MPSQHINPEALSRSRGYSQVVKVGNTVYIAGQISAGSDGNVVGKGFMEIFDFDHAVVPDAKWSV